MLSLLQRRASSPLRFFFTPAHFCSSLGIIQQYDNLVSGGALQHDIHQRQVAEALEELLDQMKDYQNVMALYHRELKAWKAKRQELRQQLLQEEAKVEAHKHLQRLANEQRGGLFSRWFLRKKKSNKYVEPGPGRMVARIKREKKLDSLVGSPPALPRGPQGLYIYGNVGCGKTMLMDIFFKATAGVVTNCRRVHFHAALLEVHDRMHKLWKKQQENKSQEEFKTPLNENAAPLTLETAMQEWIRAEEYEERRNSELPIFESVADILLSSTNDVGASVLCFDEMQVVDVFTAVAIAEIFSSLLKKGAIIVATSNREPGELNKEGMQKELFNKFVTLLQQQCRLIHVRTEQDYRRILASESSEKIQQTNYFWPLDTSAEMRLESKWQDFVQRSGGVVTSSTVPVLFGRKIEAPLSCNGAARFTFEELFDRPVGAADYIALAQHFHTIFVTGIPVMSMKYRDKARRLITLIDELYNHHCQLVCTSATSIDELFLGTEDGSLVDVDLESLQFETEAEDSRLRRNVLSLGDVSSRSATTEQKTSIQFLHSGREELFAFQRAVSRLLEMQTPVYLQAVNIKYSNSSKNEENSVGSSFAI